MPARRPAPHEVLTRRQLADALGVHPMTITKWERDGMPVAKRGGKGVPSRYDRSAVEAWQQAREDARDIGGLLSLEEERAKRERSQYELNMLKLAKERKQLLPRDQVVAEGQAFVKALQAVLRALPRRMVGAGLPREFEATVAALIREALEEISQWGTIKELEEAAREAS